MSSSVIIVIFTAIIGVIIALVSFIFRAHVLRVDKIKEVQDRCPINLVTADIAAIKTDIRWIKKKIGG